MITVLPCPSLDHAWPVAAADRHWPTSSSITVIRRPARSIPLRPSRIWLRKMLQRPPRMKRLSYNFSSAKSRQLPLLMRIWPADLGSRPCILAFDGRPQRAHNGQRRLQAHWTTRLNSEVIFAQAEKSNPWILVSTLPSVSKVLIFHQRIHHVTTRWCAW